MNALLKFISRSFFIYWSIALLIFLGLFLNTPVEFFTPNNRNLEDYKELTTIVGTVLNWSFSLYSIIIVIGLIYDLITWCFKNPKNIIHFETLLKKFSKNKKDK